MMSMQKGEARRYWSDIEIQSSIGNCYNVLDMCFAYEMNSTCYKKGTEMSKTEENKNNMKNIGKIFTLHNLLVM